MERERLVRMIEAGATQRTIAEQAGTSQTNVRYWLRRHGLKTIRSRDPSEGRRCARCGEMDPARFYAARQHQCSRCDNERTGRIQRDNRSRVVAYFGARCCHCGFDKWRSALAVHHLDPATKDPTFNSWRGWRWERLVKELALCVLLCANCHAGVHSGDVQITVP